MSAILAIDPGFERSAFVVLGDKLADCGGSGGGYELREHGLLENAALEARLGERPCSLYAEHLAIEMIASYGMPVGAEVFETCVWIGRFLRAWGGPWSFVYRRDVKLQLCGNARAKDGNVRQALLDRYPRTGGGAVPQVGTKAKPGPLFGVSRDVWSALAVGITYQATEASRSGADGAAVVGSCA